MSTYGWRSGWVSEATGITLTAVPPDGRADVTQLVGLALRDNPRRAFLLVSRVLGKHVPVPPSRAQAAAAALAAAVRHRLQHDDDTVSLVLGFAETATGLGHAVAVALDAPYLQSTRRPGDAPVALAFDEAHSHARGHVVCPSDPALLRGDGPVVLIDDELSTGRTALNTIAALQAVHPRRAYLVAALIDVRTVADRRRLAADAAELGVAVAWVALAGGVLNVPVDAAERAARARATAARQPAPAPRPARPPGQLNRLPPSWPPGVREGGRFGVTAAASLELDAAAAGVAAELALALTAGGAAARILVLGTEELLHAPMRIAAHLEAAGPAVWFSSTTRSPALVVADEEYPLRDRITFPGHDLAAGESAAESTIRFAYNVAVSPGGQPWSDIIVVVDTPGDTAQLGSPGGLLDQLRRRAATVWLVVLPLTQ